MKAFKINWTATANHPQHEYVFTQNDCKEYAYYVYRGGSYFTLDRDETKDLDKAMLFTNRGDAQSWAQGLTGAWTIHNTLPKKAGRPTGYTPSGNPPMVKKPKSWSLSNDDWEWLESQSNQSESIRQAIAHYRQSQSK